MHDWLNYLMLVRVMMLMLMVKMVHHVMWMMIGLDHRDRRR